MEKDVIIIAKNNIACFGTNNGKCTGRIKK